MFVFCNPCVRAESQVSKSASVAERKLCSATFRNGEVRKLQFLPAAVVAGSRHERSSSQLEHLLVFVLEQR